MMLDQQGALIPDRSEPWIKMAALVVRGDQGGGETLATDYPLHQQLVTKCFTVGTWNVRTLYVSGKLEQLQIVMDNYDYDILGSAEMRRTGIGETTLDNGDKIW